MTSEDAERKVIVLGKEAKALLENEAFVHACKKLELEYWEKFKQEALTEGSRAVVQAQARVLDDVRAALHVLMDSGTDTELRRDKRERQDAKSNPK